MFTRNKSYKYRYLREEIFNLVMSMFTQFIVKLLQFNNHLLQILFLFAYCTCCRIIKQTQFFKGKTNGKSSLRVYKMVSISTKQ